MKNKTPSLLLCFILIFSLVSCQRTPPAPSTPSTSAERLPPAAPVLPLPNPNLTQTIETGYTLVGAGDIAVCGLSRDDQTAHLLASIPGTIFTAGDNSNQQGTLEQYQNCFEPNWGRFKDRMRPAIGNHDAKGDLNYYTYFGEQAGASGEGYYSYNLGSWHIIVLNSNCVYEENCGPDTRQYDWLKADLEAHPDLCSLAYWHHPRFSSGLHGGNPQIDPFWQLLYESGNEIVINGHDHHYERFAPQTPSGYANEGGIRQFIVGTGGAFLRPLENEPAANSSIRIDYSFGVLRLTLYQERYEWSYIDTSGLTLDSGQGSCHP